MRVNACFVLAALFVLTVTAPAWAQAQECGQDPPDLCAYRPIYAADTTPAKRIELAEAFLSDSRKEFQESTYRISVYGKLYDSYKAEKNWDKSIDTAERSEKLVSKQEVGERVAYLVDAMNTAANDKKDINKTIELGYRVVALDPNNLRALLTLCTATPQLPPDPAGQEPILQKIAANCDKVLSLEPPDGIAPEQWQSIRKAVQIRNGTLKATVLFNKKDFPGSVSAYSDLTKLNPKDGGAYYRMGLSQYYIAKDAGDKAQAVNTALIDFIKKCNETLSCGTDENKAKIEDLTISQDMLLMDFQAKRDKAMDAFARAVVINGEGAAQSRRELETLFKTPPPPPGTLEDFIAQRQKEMGN